MQESDYTMSTYIPTPCSRHEEQFNVTLIPEAVFDFSAFDTGIAKVHQLYPKALYMFGCRSSCVTGLHA